MKKILKYTLLSASLVSLSVSSAMASISKAHEEQFVQEAKAATITTQKKAGCYTLTLSGLNNKVLYFASEPQRRAGKMGYAQFMQTWTHDKINPNGAIQAKAQNGEDATLLVSFKDPMYSAKNNTMQYTICALQGTDPAKVARLSSVTVFLDPFHPWPP